MEGRVTEDAAQPGQFPTQVNGNLRLLRRGVEQPTPAGPVVADVDVKGSTHRPRCPADHRPPVTGPPPDSETALTCPGRQLFRGRGVAQCRRQLDVIAVGRTQIGRGGEQRRIGAGDGAGILRRVRHTESDHRCHRDRNNREKPG